MLALLGALKSETASVRKRMTVDFVGAASSCRLAQGRFRGTPMVLATTGMGRQRAEAAARYVLEAYSISFLISFGFAGALTDELRVGDVVLGSALHVRADDEAQSAPLEPIALDASMRSLAEQALLRAGVDFSVAEGVTVPDLLCDVDDKTALAKATGARMVDMESYWIAAAAAERGVPFLTLRAISDTKAEGLLPFTQLMTPDGRWKARQTALYFIQKPHDVVVLLRMAGTIPRAKRTLAVSIEALMDGLGQGGGA